jgi:hypothetical protein
MVENTEQTTSSDKVGDDSTSESKTQTEVKKLEFSQEELDKKFAERQKRGEDAAAKRLEKQYKAQLDDLLGKLKQFEDKDLTDIDKLKKEHEKAISEKADLDKQLTGTKLENAKLKALIKAGVGPDQLDGLLKRVSGTTEEEIIADVEELKGLGWIGQRPATEPVKEPLKGLGTQTKTGDATPAKTLQDQLNEANAKLRDPKLAYGEKSALIDLVLQLNRKIAKGET